MRPPFLLAAMMALGATALIGCRAKIGDACRRSTDCSLQGERICDLSRRDGGGRGECIIEGCSRDSCPKEARCVKVYGSDFLSVACEPGREDIAITCSANSQSCPADCVATEDDDILVCPPLDACQANEVCLPEGLCADEITARTSCRKKCSNGGDCRGGYECTRTGTRGIYHAPDAEDPSNDGETKICTPTAD